MPERCRQIWLIIYLAAGYTRIMPMPYNGVINIYPLIIITADVFVMFWASASIVYQRQHRPDAKLLNSAILLQNSTA